MSELSCPTLSYDSGREISAECLLDDLPSQLLAVHKCLLQSHMAGLKPVKSQPAFVSYMAPVQQFLVS